MIKRFLVLPFLMLILVLLPNCSSSEAVQTDPEADMSPVISQEPENEDETVVETLAVAEDDIAEEIVVTEPEIMTPVEEEVVISDIPDPEPVVEPEPEPEAAIEDIYIPEDLAGAEGLSDAIDRYLELRAENETDVPEGETVTAEREESLTQPSDGLLTQYFESATAEDSAIVDLPETETTETVNDDIFAQYFMTADEVPQPAEEEPQLTSAEIAEALFEAAEANQFSDEPGQSPAEEQPVDEELPLTPQEEAEAMLEDAVAKYFSDESDQAPAEAQSVDEERPLTPQEEAEAMLEDAVAEYFSDEPGQTTEEDTVAETTPDLVAPESDDQLDSAMNSYFSGWSGEETEPSEVTTAESDESGTADSNPASYEVIADAYESTEPDVGVEETDAAGESSYLVFFVILGVVVVIGIVIKLVGSLLRRKK